MAQIDKLLPVYQTVETALTDLDRALAEQRAASEALLGAQSKQMQVESRHTQQNGQLLSLLREAEAYVGEGRTPNQCPVCEQNVDAVGLAQRLRERIGAMQELASIISTTGAAQSLLGTKRAFANQARNDFCQKTSRLTGLLKACSLAEIEALKLDWACFAGLLDSTQPSGALEQRAREFWEAIAASVRR